MADFEDVIKTIGKEGESFRKLLADDREERQESSGESIAKRDAQETESKERTEKTNELLEEMLVSLGAGGSPAQRDARDSEETSIQEGIGDSLEAIKNNVISEDKKGTDSGISIWGILKKSLLFGSIALAIPAIQGFLEAGGWKKLQEGFEKLKTYFNKEILPKLTIENFFALGDSVMDFINYIGECVVPSLVTAYNFIREKGADTFRYLDSGEFKKDITGITEFFENIKRDLRFFSDAAAAYNNKGVSGLASFLFDKSQRAAAKKLEEETKKLNNQAKENDLAPNREFIAEFIARQDVLKEEMKLNPLEERKTEINEEYKKLSERIRQYQNDEASFNMSSLKMDATINILNKDVFERILKLSKSSDFMKKAVDDILITRLNDLEKDIENDRNSLKRIRDKDKNEQRQDRIESREIDLKKLEKLIEIIMLPAQTLSNNGSSTVTPITNIMNAPTTSNNNATTIVGNPIVIGAPFSYSGILDGYT